MLVARLDELGKLATAGPDPAPQLVAGNLPRSLPALGHRARPKSPGLLDDLPNRPRRSEGIDRVCVIRRFYWDLRFGFWDLPFRIHLCLNSSVRRRSRFNPYNPYNPYSPFNPFNPINSFN